MVPLYIIETAKRKEFDAMAINNNKKIRALTAGKQKLIEILDTLKKSEDRVLHYPSDLEKYDVPNPHMVFSYIVSESFEDYPLISVAIDKGVKSIPDSAFTECALIECVYIPNSVEEIGARAFDHCSNLSKVDLEDGSNLKIIGARAFAMTAIREFCIPNSITELGEFAFSGCNGLEKIKFPESMTVIPAHICHDSGALYDVTIGEVTEIKKQAFRGCHLTEFSFPQTLSSIGSMAFANNSLSVVDLSETSLFSIPNMTFAKNEISVLKMPVTIQIIENMAFAYNQLTDEAIENALEMVRCVDETAFEFQEIV